MDYTRGKIYKISSDATDKIYIGSTTKDLKQRLKKHKDNYYNYLKGHYKSNVAVFDIFKLNGCVSIDLIETFSCSSAQMLRTKEQEIMEIEIYRDKLINKNRAIKKTPLELKKYGKEYYEQTKEAKKNRVERGRSD